MKRMMSRTRKTRMRSALRALALAALGVCCASAARGEILTDELTVQKVQQRYPWNGLVDIELSAGDFDMTVADEGPVVTLVVTNMTTGEEVAIETLTLNGEAFTNGVTVVTNADMRLVWDAPADVAAETLIDNAELYASVTRAFYEYMVVDVSEGSSATNYPVAYYHEPPSGGWTNDVYKTTKIVLRRIPAGTDVLGSPSDETGRTSSKEAQHTVTFTSDFWIGVYEVTQKQYELLMGSLPSMFSSFPSYKGDARPVAYVSHSTIVGDAGPVSNLVSKTGLSFTLPTDAQWEYACRAGTDGAWNNGTTITNRNEDANLSLLGRYYRNRNDGKGGYTTYFTTVGSYQPNAWGLYDMHGNVSEWCLDGEMSYSESDEVTDPVGPLSASYMIARGGYYGLSAYECRSAQRATSAVHSYLSHGFRLACPVQ